MSSPNDGGPAFPQIGRMFPVSGMTLRDWFAGQALAGFAANPVGIGNWSPDGIAQDAYKIADSMLVERTVEEAKP